MSPFILISFVFLATAMLIFIGLTFVRKSELDRVLTLDLLAIGTIAIFVVMYVHKSERFYLDIAQLMAIVGFITALVFGTFMPPDKESTDGK